VKEQNQKKSEKEDKHLCESWLEVSLDGAQSNEQHMTIESEHSMKSMMNQCGII
jgi:hypothetical protein